MATEGWTYLSYAGFGAPTAQYVLRTTPHAGNDTNNSFTYTYTYFDGLGRTYSEETKDLPAPNTTLTRNTLTAYDARGNVTAKSLPYRNGRDRQIHHHRL